MVEAKTTIRSSRRTRAHLLAGSQIEKNIALREQKRISSWWHRRRTWRSYRVGNRLGKVHPSDKDQISGFWVQFPDKSSEWVK